MSFKSALILLIFISFGASAQYSFQIVDADTREPLSGATIKILGSDTGYTTDENGYLLFQEMPDTLIHISYIGYEDLILNLGELNNNLIPLRTVPTRLNEVVITGFDDRRKLMETAGSISLISPKQIKLYSETSFVPVLNSIPGVRMEERSTGSYRISIRGSLLRSPFGVRNIKVYWNDIPFTEPNGNTPFNLLDINNAGKIEVIKGPAGSIYGAGTGGVINIQSVPVPYLEKSIEAGTTLGSYDLRRFYTRLRSSSAKSNVSFNFTNQESDGYREHSGFYRNVGQFLGRFYVSDNQTLNTAILFSDLDYKIPGGLNETQYNENPRQSRPGSIEQNASIDLKTLLIGMSHNYIFNDELDNTTSIYGILSLFQNPFITDFKRDAQQGFGGRSRFHWKTEIGNLSTSFTFGGEFQTSFVNARNFGNVDGQPDTIRFDDEIRAIQSILFSQAQIDITENWIFTAGVSFNSLKYKINRLIDAISGNPGEVTREFDPEISPRIGLVRKFAENISVHGSLSYGFSPPTVLEFRTNEGSINTDLNAEKGRNMELGIRGTILDNKLNFDVALFNFKLKETIVTRTAPSGVVIFSNAGETSQNGIELMTDYTFIDKRVGFINLLKLQTSYTYHNFTFENYVKRNEDFSGNNMTGVAPNISVSIINLETNPGFYTVFTHNFTDEIPLNDANTVFSESYNLIELKLGFKRNFGKRWNLDFFTGINNLLDEKYSLGNDLNAFGGRFFQPSPEKNYYGGVKLKYRF